MRETMIQAVQDALPIFATMTEDDMHAVAARALQDAIGTHPGLSRHGQQHAWVGLLNRAWQAYQAVEDARASLGARGLHDERAALHVSQLEQHMRASLRDLLFASNSTNVFNFGAYAPPRSDRELDALVRLPSFRLLVDAVNAVHQHLQRERPGPRDDFAFADSSRPTSWNSP